MQTNRRHFLKTSFCASFLFTLSPGKLLAKSNYGKILNSLSFDAFNGTGYEGNFGILEIEGEIPNDLNGSYFKVASSPKEKYGVTLNHFFDGDGYGTRIDFNNGTLNVHSKFIDTPQRLEEIQAQKMLFDEFGTKAKDSKGRKNNPSINIIPWRGNYLALSESGLPCLVDEDLKFIKYENFGGTIPDTLSFTAHPKFDPKTGDLYAYGIIQGATLSLKVYKIDAKTNRAEELYSKAQWQYVMIHDMILTENNIVFVIPPVTASIFDLLNKDIVMADAIKYKSSNKTRILVIPKDKTKRSHEYKIPACLVFHNANAHEEDDKLTLHSLVARDGTLLEVIKNWTKGYNGKFTPPVLTRFEIDLKSKKFLNRKNLLSNHEFPVFNTSMVGGKNRFLYATEMGPKSDPYKFQKITKLDYETNSTVQYKLNADEVCGEVCFIPRSKTTEDDGHLIFNGYSQKRQSAFVEVLDAKDLSFQGRAWLANTIPVGLHGSFVSKN